MYDACANLMKCFQSFENISFYLYVYHICCRHMKSMCEKRKFMKERFLHDFHYQIMWWEVCDVCNLHIDFIAHISQNNLVTYEYLKLCRNVK
jgi:hypothetical protein